MLVQCLLALPFVHFSFRNIITSKFLQSGKKLVHFVLFRRKSDPLSPNTLLIRSMLSEIFSNPSTLFERVWKNMVKVETSAFYWIMTCTTSDLRSKHGDSCYNMNKLHQMFHLFFFMIVDSRNTIGSTTKTKQKKRKQNKQTNKQKQKKTRKMNTTNTQTIRTQAWYYTLHTIPPQ